MTASFLFYKTLNRSESMASLCYRNLFTYITEDDLQGLRSYLENKRVLVDDKDENGATALHFAATKGKVHFVRELLNHNADVNAEDQDNWTPLLCATKEGYLDVCQELLDRDANIEHRDMGGWSALMWASYRGHTDLALMLLERGADVNAHGNYHISSLLWASGRGHVDIAKALLAAGAKVNVGDKYGTTALVWAARKGNKDIVDALLKYGANVDTAGMHSWTPLLVATMGNHVDVVMMLLELRPNVNAMDKDGFTALTIACKEGYSEIAAALIAAGAYINIQDRGGDTNLIHAVRGGHRSVIDALLKKYADVDIPGKERKTAVYSAVEKGNVPVLKMLLAANPDLEIATKDGDTPLLKAVRSRNVEAVHLLLERRAKVSAADKWGDTALHIAMRARSKAIVEVLLRNPKNSQLLYRPNRAGETPYNIDIGHAKTILGQIFGARRLNTNEDNENLLGYDLYSAALADMLSEPSLSMPITVGLYAKWGSGKSFLLGKLREEMKSFARQWTEPLLQFSWVLLVLLGHIWLVTGLALGLVTNSWTVGILVTVVLCFFSYVFLLLLWYSSQKYNWDFPYNLSINLTSRMNAVRLILQVIFCHPPGAQWSDAVAALPLRFYFTEQTRVGTTTAGESSVVQMIGSLYDAIEADYGVFSTRLYRAFRPKPIKSTSSWRWRRLCCLPNFLIFEICFIAILVMIGVTVVYVEELHLPDEQVSIDRTTVKVILFLTIGLVGVCITANIYTIGRIFKSIFQSHRRQLQSAIASLDTVKSEGFLQALKREVNLMTEMVKCLDAFTGQQTRLVVIVDGLDSCEQDKVLLILDAVHVLFSGTNNIPFIIILAIDPHIISKAVEVNSRRLLSESNIGGHDFLRNLVHLPFYLQNSGLRKVKTAQKAAMRKGFDVSSTDLTVVQTRRSSNDVSQGAEKLKVPSGSSGGRKMSRKLKMSESIASSLGSNLNRAGGPQDLTKMLLTDDYFSDVNPRSMRRLMNVVYVTGRLLKAFQMDFNWYHLASWINITEQWPYRTSWIIHYTETAEEPVDDGVPLKVLYDKIREEIPVSKEMEPLLDLDRDERKLDVFLAYHRSSLLVADLRIFLPFTINLDPYIKKVIKDEKQNAEETLAMSTFGVSRVPPVPPGWETWATPTPAPRTATSLRKQRSLVREGSLDSERLRNFYPLRSTHLVTPPPPQPWPQPPWMTPAPLVAPQPIVSQPVQPQPPIPLPMELNDLKLSSLNVNGVCQLLSKVPDISQSNVSHYISQVTKHNITGKVLKNCDMDELKRVLKMNFGDWEIFRMVLSALRVIDDSATNSRFRYGSSPPSPQQPPLNSSGGSNPVGVNINSSNKELRASSSAQDEAVRSTSKERVNAMEKQVTLEDQMICGALQTLNEEACEDVLEEGAENDTGNLMSFGDMNRTPSQSSFYSSNRDETDVIILQNSSSARWSSNFPVDDESSAGSSPETPRASRRSVSEECGDNVKLLPSSRPSSLYVPRGEKLSPARRSLSADAEPQAWLEHESCSGGHHGSDDESTPLVGASPLVSPLTPVPPMVITVSRVPSTISRQVSYLDPDPETTL
ncbi:kinase D-interacting substrate of 220 kDa isoform X5 [Halyomorpha halys]|uniref:kinase D-interacting substrate of 220 kDa isoform X5 n=1 Tax=Halyomorpha halys TaxID=286706 RepID=UPI0006D4D7EE|nr:kinase D-interacting substrate of 220 kDa isoform X4 [Halyomorpha halys]